MISFSRLIKNSSSSHDNININNENEKSLVSTSPFEFLLLSNNNSTTSSYQSINNNNNNNNNNYFTEIVDITDSESISSLESNDFLEISDNELPTTISSLVNNKFSFKSIHNMNFCDENNHQFIYHDAIQDTEIEVYKIENTTKFSNETSVYHYNDNTEKIQSFCEENIADINQGSNNILLKEELENLEYNNNTNSCSSNNSYYSDSTDQNLNFAVTLKNEDQLMLNNNNNNNNNNISTTRLYAKEKEIHNIFLNKTYKVGDTIYLINHCWVREWILYTEAPINKKSAFLIGPIDNSNLLLNSEFIKPNLIEGHHYTIVPEIVWNYFQEVYGGGPSISRKVVKTFMTEANVDLKIPIPLLFIKSSLPNQIITIYTHKNELISSLKDRACEIMGIKPENVRIWDYYNFFKHCELKSKLLVNDTNLLSNQYILLEERLEDNSFPPYRL